MTFVLCLTSGAGIMAVNVTNTSGIVVTLPWPQPDPSVPCIRLLPPIVIGTVGCTEAGLLVTSEGPQSEVNEHDYFTTLILLSERPVNYSLVVQCPVRNCFKFGPVNELENHYMLAHANHDYAPDSDEESGNK